MAQVLKLQRADGSTETAHIGSPFLAVLFEEAHHGRAAETAVDNGWMAFYDLHDRAPKDRDELMAWLKQFIGSEITDYVPPDPTATATNGSKGKDKDTKPDASSQT